MSFHILMIFYYNSLKFHCIWFFSTLSHLSLNIYWGIWYSFSEELLSLNFFKKFFLFPLFWLPFRSSLTCIQRLHVYNFLHLCLISPVFLNSSLSSCVFCLTKNKKISNLCISPSVTSSFQSISSTTLTSSPSAPYIHTVHSRNLTPPLNYAFSPWFPHPLCYFIKIPRWLIMIIHKHLDSSVLAWFIILV